METGLKSVEGFMPSKEAIMHYLDKRKETHYSKIDIALNHLFGQRGDNYLNESDVILKCAVLNAYYGTRIMNIYAVAEYYFKIIQENHLAEQISKGSLDVVEKLRKVTLGNDGKEMDFYSFATKFCSFSNPDAYPIYDKFVDMMLWELQNRDHFSSFNRKELRYYPTFVRVINDLKRFYKLDQATYRQIDNMLWLAGKETFKYLEDIK